MTAPHVYYIFNKPYGVLSQFSKEIPTHITLADYMHLSTDIYPVGRLDKDSEGLLLLTNDNKLKNRLLDPTYKSFKTYVAQLDGDVSTTAINHLKQGVMISVKGKKYKTNNAEVIKIEKPSWVIKRDPPVRYRAQIPTSWIEITIYEGKNRQIRKMCSAVGFPVLRLIRTKIKSLEFFDVEPGQYRPLTNRELEHIRK